MLAVQAALPAPAVGKYTGTNNMRYAFSGPPGVLNLRLTANIVSGSTPQAGTPPVIQQPPAVRILFGSRSAKAAMLCAD